ncbi:MAG: membrane protein insertase YidC [candidate division KSB1 bacterium]|nr:membrane protein insertase YidC [candidate division KSB1 bacterium]
MDLDKRTVIAFLLIGLILVFMNTKYYQKILFPNGIPARQSNFQSEKAAPENLPADEKSSDETKTKSHEQHQYDSEKEEEKLIIIESELYRATLSSKGGAILQWELKKYRKSDGGFVALFPESAYGNLGISFKNKLNNEIFNTGNMVFHYEGPETLTVKDPTKILFTLQLDDNKNIAKEYLFKPNQYDASLTVYLNNLEDTIDEKRVIISAPNGLASNEKSLKDDMMYAKAGTAASGVIEKGYKTNGKPKRVTADFDWVAVRTKYFAFYLLPEIETIYDVEIIGEEIQLDDNPKDRWKKFGVSIFYPYLGKKSDTIQMDLYLGPLEYDILSSYKRDMEDFMDMGWKIIKPFSIGILAVFKWMHNFIPNYGIVLLLFAVIIKVITYPLTQKSNKSMQKMQQLQPKLLEIQEKYKNDPEKLNQMTMRLYKEAGVNPMSGCFPMLLQMPLLFALFIVFRTTIELRGQGFFAWITDLSAPDSIYTFPGNFSLPLYGNSVNVLPILMGITMYIQQKMTVTDPKQKAMVYFMPIFFTILFNSFPSGLNLYYALFNLLSILQQKFMMPKMTPKPAEVKVSDDGRRKKSRK